MNVLLYNNTNHLKHENSIYLEQITEYNKLESEIHIYNNLLDNGSVLEKTNQGLEQESNTLKETIDSLKKEIATITDNIKEIS